MSKLLFSILSDEGGEERSSPVVRKDRPPALRIATLEERPFALLEDRPVGLEGPETSQRNLDSRSELSSPL